MWLQASAGRACDYCSCPLPVWCDYTFNTSTCVITESPQCTQYLSKYRLFCSWMITRGWNGWLQRGWKFWLQRGERLSGVYDLITKEVWSQIIAHSQGQYGFRFQCYDDMKTWWYDWYTIWWSGIIAYKAMMIWKPPWFDLVWSSYCTSVWYHHMIYNMMLQYDRSQSKQLPMARPQLHNASHLISSELHCLVIDALQSGFSTMCTPV